jgi:hypothetical protein
LLRITFLLPVFRERIAVKKILVVLVLLALVPATGSATELVINGGFETGDLTGWAHDGSVEVLEGAWGIDPYSGSYMAVLSRFGFLDAELSQDIDFSSLTPTLITFAYNVKGLDLVPLVDLGTDRFQVYLGTHLLVDEILDANFFFGAEATGWHTYRSYVPQEWFGGSLSFRFVTENWGAGDEGQNFLAYVDDVSAYADDVPAPVPDASSTLLLLGMGLSGLAGAARLGGRK